jgi:hypothetical protein
VIDLIKQPRKHESSIRVQEEPFSNVTVASPENEGQCAARVARFRTLIPRGMETAGALDPPRSRTTIDKEAPPSNISREAAETGERPQIIQQEMEFVSKVGRSIYLFMHKGNRRYITETCGRIEVDASDKTLETAGT